MNDIRFASFAALLLRVGLTLATAVQALLGSGAYALRLGGYRARWPTRQASPPVPR